jgi:hypothetical protein
MQNLSIIYDFLSFMCLEILGDISISTLVASHAFSFLSPLENCKLLRYVVARSEILFMEYDTMCKNNYDAIFCDVGAVRGGAMI